MIHQILNGDLGTEQYIFQFDILIQGRSFPFNEQLIERLKVGSMASKVVGDLRLQIVFVEKFLIAFRINQTQLIGVSLWSALSCRNKMRYSAREVNMR